MPIHMSYAFFCPWTSQRVDLQGGEGSWVWGVYLFANVTTCRVFFLSFGWGLYSQLETYIYLKKTSMYIYVYRLDVHIKGVFKGGVTTSSIGVFLVVRWSRWGILIPWSPNEIKNPSIP